MAVEIVAIADKRGLNEFLRVPYDVYADDPHYVFPLQRDQKAFFDPDHNPFHRHAETQLWVARRGGRAVGRVAACIDSYNNDHHQEKVCFFGFFETVADEEVARALLDAARGWAQARDMERLRGPACFTTNHDYLGLLIQGHERDPVVGMPYQPPYYEGMFEEYGFSGVKDLYAWFLSPGGTVPAKLQKLIDSILRNATFTVRPFRMKRFEEDASIVRALYNECWSRNWGFIPMDDAEFAYAAKDMKGMVDPDFLLIAENDGEPIGFSLTIPDFNHALKPLRGRLFPFGWLKFLLAKRNIELARTLLMGVLPAHRKKGVDAVMVYRTIEAGFRKGMTRGECSWVLEDNRAMNLIMRSYGADLYKTYRIYELPLS